MYSLPRNKDFSELFSLEIPKRYQKYPTSIISAVHQLSWDTYADICNSLFHGQEIVGSVDIAKAAIELDMCGSQNSPIRVYLDPERVFSVLVYSNEDHEEFENASV